jgi:Ca2+-binding EF-hand superfamily protein
MRKFNILDADTNGYLEKEELEAEPLFQLGLFDQIDTDADEKVFSEELESYVRERAEMKAMSCRVNIFDTGSGFFQVMDHNNDGRISEREMRSSDVSLKSLATDANPGVSQDEPSRRYHIEFSRGSFLLFGSGQQVSKQSISFNTQVAVGPPWFVGSDRNNDGDLTWNEFLGHREDFHFLDLDQDGLIDPIEATRAEELTTNQSSLRGP